MSVLDLPAPSHTWSFFRGIAVGLVLAGGGFAAFRAFEGPSSVSVLATSPVNDSDKLAFDRLAAPYGIKPDARMYRALCIYRDALRSQRGSSELGAILLLASLKDYSQDQRVPFNDLLADQLRGIVSAGSIDGRSEMPESFREGIRLLHEMDFE